MNNQLWQFLACILLVWFKGYVFGFLAGSAYGANDVLERLLKHNIQTDAKSEKHRKEDNG